ncbi:MAG: hypothetical protein CUN52_06365 [Phototrophicales bacterium]|nr:MAG: hypothetical protein CUN52_06365 [Phototrophicales bacterium]
MTDKPIQVDERVRRANQMDDEYEYEEVDEERGCSGCAWGLVGLVGCLGIPVGVILFVIIGGANIIGNIFNGIGQIFNPPPPVYQTVSQQAVLESVRQLSDLTTVEYNFSQIITSERELPPILQALYSDRLVYFAVGRIQAGVNLSAIQPQDVIINNTTLTIILPPPVLQDCFIDEGASGVISRDTGVFASPAPNIESEARKTALVHFRGLSIQEGILLRANTEAKTTLEAFLGLLPIAGVDTIEIITQEPNTQSMTFPSSCTP